MSNRNFGVEIEIEGCSYEAAALALREQGIMTYSVHDQMTTDNLFTGNYEGPMESNFQYCCNGCDYSNRNRYFAVTNELTNAWRVISDGSLNQGCEVVSPILSGEEGLAMLKVVVAVLRRAGARIENTCGFHVHVDARDLDGIDLASVVRRYGKFEETIDSFMAPRRRGQNPQWCASVQELAREFQNIRRLPADEIARWQDDRYYKVNLCAFLKHGTIEFRQHAGTLNIDKMTNWVRFCVNFVEASRVGGETKTAWGDTSPRAPFTMPEVTGSPYDGIPVEVSDYLRRRTEEIGHLQVRQARRPARRR